MSSIHDMIWNVYIWYPRYTMFMFGSRLWFYVLYIPSHQIFPYLITGETQQWLTGHRHVSKSVTSLCPTQWLNWLNSLPNLITICQKLWPPCASTHTDRQTHPGTILCVYIYIYKITYKLIILVANIRPISMMLADYFTKWRKLHKWI